MPGIYKNGYFPTAFQKIPLLTPNRFQKNTCKSLHANVKTDLFLNLHFVFRYKCLQLMLSFSVNEAKTHKK